MTRRIRTPLLGNDYEWDRRVARQAHGDRTDYSMRDERRTAHDDYHGGIGMGGAHVLRCREQLLCDQALAALKPPAFLPALQLLAAMLRSSCSTSSKLPSSSATAVADSAAMLGMWAT